jgi:hypothetical protein
LKSSKAGFCQEKMTGANLVSEGKLVKESVSEQLVVPCCAPLAEAFPACWLYLFSARLADLKMQTLGYFPVHSDLERKGFLSADLKVHSLHCAPVLFETQRKRFFNKKVSLCLFSEFLKCFLASSL